MSNKTVSNKSFILRQIGNPVVIDRDLQKFRSSARMLSSKHRGLIKEYPKQWVAVYNGQVQGHGSSLNSILKIISDKKLPRAHTIIRFIDKNQKTMIL